jgi:acetate kinase
LKAFTPSVIGTPRSSFESNCGRPEVEPVATQQEAMELITRYLADSNLPMPGTIEHRIVHGGPELRRHCVIDETVLCELDTASVFVTLHLPPALKLVRAARIY